MSVRDADVFAQTVHGVVGPDQPIAIRDLHRALGDTAPNPIPVAAVAVAAIGPFAGMGVAYALSSPGHRVWPMVAGFFLGGLAGSSAATVISWPTTVKTPAPAPTLV